jgi:hypothetical protein
MAAAEFREMQREDNLRPLRLALLAMTNVKGAYLFQGTNKKVTLHP